MRWLTLIRHAQAAPMDGRYRDFDRPLVTQGQQDARLLAEQLLQLQPPPQRLLSSPAVRALSTAQTVAAALGRPAVEVTQTPEIYEAGAPALLQLLRSQQGDHVLLVGHNPGISQLALMLAACPFHELPTAGLVQLELAIEDWSMLRTGQGKVLQYSVPARSRIPR